MIILQDRPMFSHINGKLSPKCFELITWLGRGFLKIYQNTHYSLNFQDRLMVSHINGKLSLRPFQ